MAKTETATLAGTQQETVQKACVDLACGSNGVTDRVVGREESAPGGGHGDRHHPTLR